MAVREELSFDYGWRFHKGDIARPPLLNYMATYHGASAESGRGGAAAAFDDAHWEIVDLPHDLVISTKPDANENEDHGYVHRDNGWYRNYFYIDEANGDRRFSLRFDGVATQCIVWVNGVELLRNFTAGTSFEVDFTDVARFGEEVNVVSVYIDNSAFEGWYYEGGGLYRHVWMVVSDRLCIAHDGVFVKPVLCPKNDWDVQIETTLFNDSFAQRSGELISRICDAGGKTVGLATQRFTAAPREKTMVPSRAWIANPVLWSLEHPTLYTLHTTIEEGGCVVDAIDTAFGFRTLDFCPESGFYLNGEHVKIKGMCVHQEHGGLGVAIPDGVLEYRVKRLLEMGCNAIRTAHNPPAPQLLDICDQLGMLVMDENRWLDSAPEGMNQLEALILRDRNHPSVFMWSMFNEESAMMYGYGVRIMNAMRARAHQLDDARPVTYAQNAGLLQEGVAETGDIVGINYNNHWYPKLRALVPDAMLFGAETIGYINGRLNEVMDTWNTALLNEYHGGIFAWTGFDYRGEAHWPDVYFRFGAMDPSGCAKDGYYLYQAYWTDVPMVHIATTWKNDAQIGSAQQVRVYTNTKRVQLFADGESLGTKDVDPAYQTMWEFTFRACALEAVCYGEDGAEIARTRLDNPQKPHHLQIKREEQIALPTANATDVAIFNIWAVDESGKVCDRAEGELLHIGIEGPAKVLCVGDGDVRDYEPWGSMNARLRRGHCQIILRARDQPGTVAIHAKSEKLGSATASLEILTGAPRARVSSVRNMFISAWLRSPVYEGIKDPAGMLDQDPADWFPFHTSDTVATHAILTDGCVGFCADTVIPPADKPGKVRAQIVIEANDNKCALRIEPDAASGFEKIRMDIDKHDEVVIDLPEAYQPGLKLRLRIGVSPLQNHDHIAIRSNIRWRFQQV